jgi:pantoate--beta-alanine ligase
MRIITSVIEMQAVAEDLRQSQIIGFVPTMGYLHEGHLALVRKARSTGDVVVVSIFVNPTQFGPTEDLARYPRDFERDRDLLEQEKTDIIFIPDRDEVYPRRYSTYVQVKELEDHLCGKVRPGHFVGVATVVAKLFLMVKPNFAVFGQKDYQQLKIIERMVQDLNIDVRIVAHPTVREPDGLAMSSRNSYLTADERKRALAIYASLGKAEELFRSGERDAAILKAAILEVLTLRGGLDVEYVNICDTETLEDIAKVAGKALLAIACRVGATRLIDNTILMEELRCKEL